MLSTRLRCSLPISCGLSCSGICLDMLSHSLFRGGASPSLLASAAADQLPQLLGSVGLAASAQSAAERNRPLRHFTTRSLDIAQQGKRCAASTFKHITQLPQLLSDTISVSSPCVLQKHPATLAKHANPRTCNSWLQCRRYPLTGGIPSLSATLPYGMSNRTASTSTAAGKQSDVFNNRPDNLDFGDYESIYKGRSTYELLRSYLVFRLCAFQPFTRNADTLVAVSKKVLGQTITMSLFRHTFFRHFCAGETPEEVKATMDRLRSSSGVSAILDYAAENDVAASTPDQPPLPLHDAHAAPPGTSSSSSASDLGFGSSSSSSTANIVSSAATRSDRQMGDSAKLDMAKPSSSASTTEATPGAVGAVPPTGTGRPSSGSGGGGGAVARVYSYSSEEACDHHVEAFLSSIDTAAMMPGQGFAAIKVTALGNPLLLERMSSSIRAVLAIFKCFDEDGSGFIDRQEFDRQYTRLFEGTTQEERDAVFEWMDTAKEGRIDYVGWTQRLSLHKMPEYSARIVPNSDSKQKLSSACLTEEEVALVDAIRRRLDTLVEAAVSKKVKLMVDAEHTYFQPAIDHLVIRLMKKYNKQGEAVVFNTYQAYLKDTGRRIVTDIERSRREGYVFACKLVRGAYLELERARAQQQGYEDPCQPGIDATHKSYNACMRRMLDEVAGGEAEVLIGTHNQMSIELAVAHMQELQLDPTTSHVYFGQLLGMSDHLSVTLGKHGYRVFKYVPYGKVEEVIPYLLRRAQENQSILKGAKADLQLLGLEISRRFWSSLGLGGGRKSGQASTSTVHA